MEYKKLEQKQKTVFAAALAAAVVILGLAVSFLLSSSIVSGPNDTTPTKPPVETLNPLESELVFEDEALIRAIQKQLGTTDVLTKEQVQSLTVLDYTQEVITSLKGLEHAISLKELKLKVNVTTIYPITYLNLTKLTLVSDVSVQPLIDEMGDLKHVTWLDLSDCGISALGYLSEMPSLETLILDNNRVTGLAYLNEMPFLTTVSLKNNNITDISVFKSNLTIKNLYIDNNLITDISPLEHMEALENCTYENNPIKVNDEHDE